MSVTPAQIWWTARELAAAALPDMPRAQTGVDAMISRQGWRGDPHHARRRAGRGGGWEYHWKLLPLNAQKRLLADAAPRGAAADKSRDEIWEWFEGLPETVKAKAEARLAIIGKVEALEGAGATRFLAVAEVARLEDISERTIWNWLSSIDGVRREDRLAHLAPRHRGARRKATKGQYSPEFWDFLKADYLRLEQPSFTSCYRRATRVAGENGWDVLPERTMRRRLYAEVSKPSLILARKGVDALKAMYPAQTRDKTCLHAMEAVNADFHKFDVFVRWPRYEGDNEGEILRPQMMALQDIYSGRVLAWRVDRTPNKSCVALAIGDMVETFGIPDHVLLDNGREFANKFLTGQAQTRHRFKIKDDDIPGILVSLGCEIHWATPYSGQSKPIERAFRDMCDAIAKDPRFAGAYTGNRPEAKPENYGARAIELDEFLHVLAEGIEEHNTRRGRKSASAMGRSFIETFDASYASAPISKATEAQRRLWLMGAEGLKADAKNGLIRFMKNEYWSPWMTEIAGQRVVARFDPEDFKTGLHIYALTGEYMGHADPRDISGFFDLAEARAHGKARRDWQRAERAALEAHRRLSITEISAHLDGSAPPPTKPAAAKVVRPVFKAKPAAPQVDPALEAAQQALVADLNKARAARPVEDETPLTRFRRALEIEAAVTGGKPVSRDEECWLSSYQTQPEYRAQMKLFEDFGEGMFG